MKKILLFSIITFLAILSLHAQVTQINNNKSLEVTYPLTSTKTIIVSSIDSSIWVSDATLPGTVQISPNIKYEGYGGVIGGNFIFRGSTPATGSEIYESDGTPGGTVLVKDIVTGPVGSRPGDFAIFNGFIYFSATTAAEGRELWRTNGTNAGTTLFKDIRSGTDSSNNIDQYHISATPAYFVFAAQSALEGIELWKSDGTSGGTVLVKDINTGNSGADSSNPREFFYYNNMFLFFATDATHGEELWKTDGTTGGTSLVKDINTGTDSSTALNFSIAPGFSFAYPIFLGFHLFNNKVYFNATDGASVGEVWSSDGTPGNTTLLKDVIPSVFDPFDPQIPYILLVDAVNLPAKFIFPVSNGLGQSELWESDGTPAGTKVFKAFSPNHPGELPIIFVPFSYNSSGFSQSLFMGNKFFFAASTTAEGYELWISDGTLGGTNIVKDIKPGNGNGIDTTNSFSYLYTNTQLFFAATDATHGNELWSTDGTPGNTTLVKDIYVNAGNAAPGLSILTAGGNIFFTATDGDDPNHRDLFVVNGLFQPLPVKLTDLTVKALGNDALLEWSTLQEINTKEFTVQRSFDALHFTDAGTVAASGNSSNKNAYSFVDPGIVNSGNGEVYYRLLISDRDGKTENSKVVLLKLKPNSAWGLRIIGNPVKGSINILLNGITGKIKLYIKDVNGKAIFANTFENANGLVSIPLNLPHGAYVLVAEKNNERRTIRFIK